MKAGRSDIAIELPEGSGWDWNVLAWDGGRFRLAEGADITCHHDLDLTFTNPAFVCRPADFEDPVFRTVTSEELPALARRFGGCPPVVVAFEADAGGVDPVTCLVAAERLDIVQGTVLRYWREDMVPGRGFAPWVRPPAE